MKNLLVFVIFSASLLASTSAHSQTISTFAGVGGSAGFSGDGGPATAGKLYSPIDVFVAPWGDAYIADRWNNRIRKVSSSGIITTVAGNGTSAWGADGVPATATGIGFPRSLCMDGSGNIYFSDEGNRRIRKITPGGLIYNVAGTGNLGYSGDGGPATAADIGIPQFICADAAGNLYFSSVSQVIRKINTAGIISTFAGNGTGGYSGDGGPATTAQFLAPNGLCADQAGNIYIVDGSSHVIRKVDPAGIISTFAGNGTEAYTGDGGPATNASLAWPEDVCADGGGNIFITDRGNNVVRKVSASGSISTIAGNGTIGLTGDGGAATAAQLAFPIGVCMDISGNLYIADHNANRIRKVTGAGVTVNEVKKTGIALQPNPTASVVSIRHTGPVDAQVISMDGRLLLEVKKTTQVNLGTLPVGVYTIRLSDAFTGEFLVTQLVSRN